MPPSARSAGTISSALVSTTPEDLQVDQIESELLASTAPVALHSYGVTIEQIRLERIALPEENVQAVFEQMRAERRQFAAKFEAEGERDASAIRSEAELEAATIRAKGSRGAGPYSRSDRRRRWPRPTGTRIAIDPELYRFTRSLESLDKLVTGNTSLILRTDSEPFSLLQNKDSEVRTHGHPVRDPPPRGAARRMSSTGRGSACTGGSPPWLLLYAVSGITIVKSDEVAVILRWGRLVGRHAGPAGARRRAALRVPQADRRRRAVPVKHVYEVTVTRWHPRRRTTTAYADSTLDPITQGYALTGDHNIVHANMVARYRVRDAAEWAFYGPNVDDVLRVEVTAAMVRSLGEMGVDRVLADGRKDSDCRDQRAGASRPRRLPVRSRARRRWSSRACRRRSPWPATSMRCRARSSAPRRSRRRRRPSPQARSRTRTRMPTRCCRRRARTPGGAGKSPRRMPRRFWLWIASTGPTPPSSASACIATPSSTRWGSPEACAGYPRRTAARYSGLRITLHPSVRHRGS